MAQATNLTVKKADGTTDVTYALISASAGDKSPAIWQQAAASLIPAFRPNYALDSAWNGSKTARRVHSRLLMPYVATLSDGTQSLLNRCLLDITGVFPQDIPSGLVMECVYQGANLFNTALVKESFSSGYSPV